MSEQKFNCQSCSRHARAESLQEGATVNARLDTPPKCGTLVGSICSLGFVRMVTEQAASA